MTTTYLSNISALTLRRTDVPEDEEIIRLNRKVDDHISEYKGHVRDYEADYRMNDEQHKNNMKAIEALTISTQGVVDAWTTASMFQKFVKWLSGFAILAAAIAWTADKLPHG